MDNQTQIRDKKDRWIKQKNYWMIESSLQKSFNYTLNYQQQTKLTSKHTNKNRKNHQNRIKINHFPRGGNP